MGRWFALLFASLLIVGGAGTARAEGETEREQPITIGVTATYGQTEARRQLALVNEFRTGKDAWYWNEDNETKTVFNTSGEDSLGLLEYDYDLERTAMLRAMEIVLYFEHERPVGGYAWDLYEHLWASENIGIGYGMYTTSESIFQGWREDDEDYIGQDHRRNMLDPDVTAMAAAYVHFGGYHFWVQLFRSPTGSTQETAAVDSEETVSVEVLPSLIDDFRLSASERRLIMLPELSKPIPELTMELRLSQTWPQDKHYPVTVPYTWSVEDPSIAEISDGRIRGLQCGATSLVATAASMDKTISIPIKVEPFPVEIIEDDPGVLLVPELKLP